MSGSGKGLDDHLRDLADHLSSALWVIGPDGSRMLYCSGAYETLWGRPLEELYADPDSWIAGVHPDDRARVEALWHGRHEGYEAEYRVVRPDGSVIHVHSRGEPVRDEAGRLVRLAGFTVFRLTHRFAETWAGGRLRLATSRRERNGKATEMVARQAPGGGGILAQGPEGEFRLPAEAAPLSWWDPTLFSSRPLFDSDTGRPLQLRWTRQALPGGAVRWRASDAEESEGTYAADGTWLDWRTKGEDGSLVTYVRA